jgi:cytochrome P450
VTPLPYLNAVIEETLRMYSPVPVALTRIVPPGGAPISGHWVPGNVSYPRLFSVSRLTRKTTVGIPHRAAFRSSRNFADPSSFVPERWLPGKDSKFDNDRELVFQPFSAGPRNCLGKGYEIHVCFLPPCLTNYLPSLADAEMRLILAHLLFSFDFKLVDKESRWDEQQAYLLYQKPPLMLHVESRR